MTDPTAPDPGAAPAAVPNQAEPATRLRQALDNLATALEGLRQAVAASGDTVPASARLLESWRAANLRMHQMVDDLYFEGRHAITAIPDRPGEE
jgi:hypothetical protein